MLQWRNTVLDFSSLAALQVSLAAAPGHEALTRAPLGEDQRVLEHASRDPDVREMAVGAGAVERLWEACLVPDYRKLSPAAHAELVTALFTFLMRKGRIPDQWFAAQVAQADRVDGDIDTLSARISQIRTWTFAANRPDWLSDPLHWQETTRAVEDKLSDALHSRLTERFVDRRTSVLMRRLRENTMLTTEIGKTGEVTVEGHVIGRLDGFMFAPDAAEAGSEAKALQATALKALAGEIDARAEKLSAAADDQFALASDGTLRWTGDAVGKLVSADEVLHPRIRIIADERLTGSSRDAVQARLDLWFKTHVEKILGPMFELSKAEDVTGIARGIAFQLNEALGVLERPKIAAEMKDLDQPSRAVLRKYGVRFGAYHIFFPALLKPGARTLASLLWALKQDDVDMNALGGAQHLAASGRTSFPADKALSQDAYRVLGYKLAGERAVRVDILERLADLIRPALAWRETSPGPKPSGAFDGRGFTVTQAMTSLTGSAGEDFASVLRSLGYRMDRRAPLPEEPKPVETPAAAAPENEPAAPQADTTPEAANEAAVAETAPVEAEAATEASADLASASKLPEVAFAPAETAEQAETASEAAPAVGGAEASHPDTTAVSEEASPSGEVAAATAPAEPELVEVWRPAGRHDERRPKHDRNRHHRRPSHAAAPEAGAAAEAGDKVERPGGPRRHNRDRAREDRKPRPEGEGAQARGPREERGDRPHQRFKGKGKFEGKRDGRDRKDSGPAFRTFATSAPRERERVADPNSPFAKLAALKDQLGNRKD
jgi:ATP-dependent RNA helicase SUPV3L1/SUV3